MEELFKEMKQDYDGQIAQINDIAKKQGNKILSMDNRMDNIAKALKD